MEQFNKQRDTGLLSQQEKNRHEETETLEALERDLEVKEGDNPWLRVAKLVDMTRDPKVRTSALAGGQLFCVEEVPINDLWSPSQSKDLLLFAMISDTFAIHHDTRLREKTKSRACARF